MVLLNQHFWRLLKRLKRTSSIKDCVFGNRQENTKKNILLLVSSLFSYTTVSNSKRFLPCSKCWWCQWTATDARSQSGPQTRPCPSSWTGTRRTCTATRGCACSARAQSCRRKTHTATCTCRTATVSGHGQPPRGAQAAVARAPRPPTRRWPARALCARSRPWRRDFLPHDFPPKCASECSRKMLEQEEISGGIGWLLQKWVKLLSRLFGK